MRASRAQSHELSVATWDRVQGINLRGVWLCQKGGDYADVEVRGGFGDEVCVSLKGG
jgi:hypothetical protein